MSEPIDIGDPDPTPIFTRDMNTGKVIVEWPNGRPDVVMCQPDLLDQILDDRNDMIDLIALLQKEYLDVGLSPDSVRVQELLVKLNLPL